MNLSPRSRQAVAGSISSRLNRTWAGLVA